MKRRSAVWKPSNWFVANIICAGDTWGLRLGLVYHCYDGHWLDLNIVIACVRINAMLALKTGSSL